MDEALRGGFIGDEKGVEPTLGSRSGQSSLRSSTPRRIGRWARCITCAPPTCGWAGQAAEEWEAANRYYFWRWSAVRATACCTRVSSRLALAGDRRAIALMRRALELAPYEPAAQYALAETGCCFWDGSSGFERGLQGNDRPGHKKFRNKGRHRESGEDKQMVQRAGNVVGNQADAPAPYEEPGSPGRLRGRSRREMAAAQDTAPCRHGLGAHCGAPADGSEPDMGLDRSGKPGVRVVAVWCFVCPRNDDLLPLKATDLLVLVGGAWLLYLALYLAPLPAFIVKAVSPQVYSAYARMYDIAEQPEPYAYLNPRPLPESAGPAQAGHVLFGVPARRGFGDQQVPAQVRAIRASGSGCDRSGDWYGCQCSERGSGASKAPGRSLEYTARDVRESKPLCGVSGHECRGRSWPELVLP